MKALLEPAPNESRRKAWSSALFAGGGTQCAERSVVFWLPLLALLKLALVSNQDIVAWYHPHDDYWQILSAAHWVWWRPYDQWTLMHLPVYPTFVALAGAIGLPLRIAIELFYIGGAATLTFALGRLGVPGLLRIVIFTMIVFHPYSYAEFDYAFAETLYACLMLYLVALFIRLLAPASRSDLIWNAALFATVMALMWHCRKESILLGGLLALMTLAILAALFRGLLSRTDAVRLGLVLIAAPAFAIAAVGALISTANGLRYGLWHTNQMVVPNYVRAYSTLQAIRPDHPIRFVPISREARQKAYAVSPAFRELAPFIDGERENWGAWFTRQNLGIK